MAVVTFNKKDFEGLVGKSLSEEEYKKKIPMMGTPLEDFREDEIDFEVFPNRPDLLSVEGFARAVQGFLGIKNGLVKYDVKKSDYEVKVDKKLAGIRGCAAFAVVKGVNFTDELVAAFMQLQKKLSLTIGRRRAKASIGTYDLRDIEFPVRLTTKPGTFKFRPLEFNKEMSIKEVLEKHPKGQQYGHLLKGWKSYPVYLDKNENVLSLLPIINAESSKIRPDTKEMLIEVTGTEWKAVFEMLKICASAFADRGCEIYEVQTNYSKKKVTAPTLKPWKMELDIDFVNKLLDLNLKPNEVESALKKMRYGASNENVFVPSYRTDVLHPIDLIEDIAIAHGYEKFEPRIPKIPTIGKENKAESFSNTLKEIMVGLGFQEIVSFILSNEEKQFDKVNKRKNGYVKIQNPTTEDYTMARVSLIPSVLETFSQNLSSEMPQKVFEIGITAQIDKKAETGASNKRKLSAGIMHSSANYSEMKSYLDSFFTIIGKEFTIKKSSDKCFISGRAADILLNKKKIGVIGEVHPEVLTDFGIDYPVVLFEVVVENLF